MSKPNDVAVAAFISRKTEINAALQRIRVASDSSKRIIDALYHEGEYTR